MARASLQGDGAENLNRGLWAAVAAVFMFTLMNVFAKYLSARHSVIEIAFYRNVIACVPFVAAIFLFGRREILIIQSKPRVIAGRAVLGTATLITTFAAYSLMPMAETTVLIFASSLFIPVLGVLLLGESVGPYRWTAVLAGFIGVAIMANPGGDVNTLGVIVALCAALMQAFMGILLRHLGGHERPETITFYFFVIGIVLTGLALPFVATMPTLEEIPFLLGVGLSGAAAQWFYATALKYTPAAIVAVVNFSGIVWATLFGWLIWNDWPLPTVFAGASVVIAANILIVWREARLKKSLKSEVPPVP